MLSLYDIDQKLNTILAKLERIEKLLSKEEKKYYCEKCGDPVKEGEKICFMCDKETWKNIEKYEGGVIFLSCPSTFLLL